MLRPGQHIHVVGVGGFGMSAIARVLLQMGYTVSGSDRQANSFTRELQALGARIYQGHRTEQVAGADIVLATSAATGDNPEIAAAQAAGIPVLRRQDMLGELMAQQVGIAIAGTHGKTTTSALLAHVLTEAGRDPSYIVGGVLANSGTNARYGRGAHFVIEADEYDRMFLGLRPQIAVITNIEHDHPDCYPALDDVLAAFAAFMRLVPPGEPCVVCADDDHARALARERARAGGRVVWYGVGEHVLALDPGGGWTARDIAPDAGGGTAFTVRHGTQEWGRVRLALGGRHNVQNALAVLAVADRIGVPPEQVTAALASFRGTGRRAETLGQAGGVTVISDYAHHPTEIRVTLAALRERPGVRELWAVWQPHTYGRLRLLADDFARAFGAADHVLVTDVYSVREQVGPGLDAQGIVGRIGDAGHPDVRYTGALNATARALAAEVRPGDVVALLSAGDAPATIGALLLDELRARGH